MNKMRDIKSSEKSEVVGKEKEDGKNDQLQREDFIIGDPKHKPHWKRIHHTWSFWIFLVLMLTAILYYIMTVDFAFAPRIQQKPENNRAF